MLSIEGFKKREVDALFLRNSFSNLTIIAFSLVSYLILKITQKFIEKKKLV
jgi:hypothetical protein